MGFTAAHGTWEVSKIHLLNYSVLRSIEIAFLENSTYSFSLGDFYKTFLISLLWTGGECLL